MYSIIRIVDIKITHYNVNWENTKKLIQIIDIFMNICGVFSMQ